MSCDFIPCLSCLAVNSERYIRQRRDMKVNRVRVDYTPWRNSHRRRAIKRQVLDRGRINPSYTRTPVHRQCHRARSDRQVRLPEEIRKLEPDAFSSNRYPECLAQCSVFELGGDVLSALLLLVDWLVLPIRLRMELANGAGARLATSTSCVVAVHVAIQCLSCRLMGLLATGDAKRAYAATSTYCSLANFMMR